MYFEGDSSSGVQVSCDRGMRIEIRVSKAVSVEISLGISGIVQVKIPEICHEHQAVVSSRIRESPTVDTQVAFFEQIVICAQL
jgi:hypothetical protein